MNQKEELFKYTYQKALQLLSRRAYTSQKLKDKLLSSYPQEEVIVEEVVEEVVKKIIDLRYLNDHDYFRKRSETLKLKGLGPHRIKQQLLKDGLSEQQIARYQMEYQHEDSSPFSSDSSTSDSSLLHVVNYLRRKKALLIQDIHVYENELKIKKHLLYKGHSFYQIDLIIKEIKKI